MRLTEPLPRTCIHKHNQLSQPLNIDRSDAQSHTSSCVPPIPPYSFIPPLHLPHSSSLPPPPLLLSTSLVQVFPPVPKTSLKIDCLAVLVLNMHRISHLPLPRSVPRPASPPSSVHARFPPSSTFLSCSVF